MLLCVSTGRTVSIHFPGNNAWILSFKGLGKYCNEVVELAGLNVFTLGGGRGSLFLGNVWQSVNQSKQKQAKKLERTLYIFIM